MELMLRIDVIKALAQAMQGMAEQGDIVSMAQASFTWQTLRKQADDLCKQLDELTFDPFVAQSEAMINLWRECQEHPERFEIEIRPDGSKSYRRKGDGNLPDIELR